VVLYVISGSQADVFNLVVLVIKAFAIDLEFDLYIKLLSVKVYITVFVKELIRIIYLSLILCVCNVCI
jgi:hypothetical protein